VKVREGMKKSQKKPKLVTDSFLRKWLKNPMQIGSVRPSSKKLAKLMVNQVPKDAKVIVEFGAGTGPITEALCEAFPKAEIYSFELDRELAAKVQKKCPNVHVIAFDVTEAELHLPEEAIGQVSVILSSLPFLNIPKKNHRQILETAFRILKPQAAFVQFTYLPFLPPLQAYQELGLWAQYVASEVKNLPPAYVWAFRKDLRNGER
jgi:phosphatidylethanolamine/phosphatidyl-N-methylethanolamine N-methyltransferase